MSEINYEDGNFKLSIILVIFRGMLTNRDVGHPIISRLTSHRPPKRVWLTSTRTRQEIDSKQCSEPS